MKYTTENEFKGLLREFFKRKILESIGVESVDSANAGFTSDYKDEHEGPGTRYEIPEESVDRATRGEETEGEYEEEDEGPGTTYEHLKFETNFYHDADTEKVGHDHKPDISETNLYSDSEIEKVSGKEDISHSPELGETNLYTDADKEGAEKVDETNLYSDAEKEGGDTGPKGVDPTKKKGKGHAAVRSAKGDYPGPPHGLTAGKIPRLKDVFGEGRIMLGLIEIAPPGWEKTVKGMKKHPEIENPWALAWSMKKKGAKPGGKKK